MRLYFHIYKYIINLLSIQSKNQLLPNFTNKTNDECYQKRTTLVYNNNGMIITGYKFLTMVHIVLNFSRTLGNKSITSDNRVKAQTNMLLVVR